MVMSENSNTPDDVAKNLGNVLSAQKKSMEEPVKKEDVKQKIQTPRIHNHTPQENTSNEFVPFKGFNYSKETIAKTEITLPVLKTSVRLSPIVFKEELAIAQTMIEDKDITLDVLQLLFRHIVEGPNVLTESFDSFVKHLLEVDFSTLLYGFYINSYGIEPVLDLKIPCSECGHKHEIKKINLIDLYNETTFEGEEFEALNFEKECDISDYGLDAKFHFRFNNMERHLKMKNISKSNFLNEIASGDIIDHVDRFTTNGSEYEDEESIKNAIETLTSSARKVVKDCIKENFSKYGMKLIYKWKCNGKVPDPNALKENAKKECMHENELPIQINELFFREISESIS
jgi:hypothetical protein